MPEPVIASHPRPLSRRSLLRHTAAVSAGLLGGPTVLSWLADPAVAAAAKAFVDDYRSNTTANLTVDTNAAVRILSGVQRLWQTGPTWDTGVPLAPEVLRANVRYCAAVTAARTEAQAARAFICDRQHQSYAVIAGLGVLADVYKAGALAVTSITEAPTGTPATTVSDAVPPDAPPGSAIGAGSPTSALGAVVTLVNTVRGPFASSNPSKFAVQYPRPWRMTEESEVIDTGAVDDLGYPIYRSDVTVAPQLLRQRSRTPADDGGFPSGHTNALHLAALAFAYAVPERFQELVTCAFDLSDTRITAGMHSPLDVVGGRVLATALAAAALNDPANAELKVAAREQAAAYLQERTGTTADTLFGYAHRADRTVDPYADRTANQRLVAPKLTYILPRRGEDEPLTVPRGAEVLLETRQPYLTADQRRAVLRSTALPAGYALLDGPEQWGRLHLFAAADGYGAFEDDVDVTLDAARGGFHAADTWRNDIGGPGGLTLRGTGTLGLTGRNRFRGGVRVLGGTLDAGSPGALGSGDVEVHAATLRLAQATVLHGDYRQRGGVLAAAGCRGGQAALTVAGTAEIGRGTTLELTVEAGAHLVPVLRARRVVGRFDTITVRTPGYRAEPVYTRHAVLVRVRRG
ncbi:phosphatase PAP2 family protein [Micromonospora sp. KC723]|uniref:phosphatase PAP2 family protein n=1 Tax=Micromonospora sp. KC723 TaxID=2530381 RepID=UPI00104FFCB8|nr:phosphatase PAP2 family protein [Micromonospora sp. KC723]TDB76915.1 phosphatase PAP2 family protein [Micromonospora sp. KC723]